MFLHDFDVILVMSVEPGASGQKFINNSLNKIKLLDEIRRENGYNYKIEVDGGVNESNSQDIIDAGADMLVSGSYVYKSSDHQQAIENLRKRDK